MKNYAMKIASSQEQNLTGPARMADMVIARDAGLDMPPRFEWRLLVDISDQEQAETLKNVSDSVSTLVERFIIREDQAQDIVSRLAMVGPLNRPHAGAARARAARRSDGRR